MGDGHTLNRIQSYASADIGMGGHMIKNFETITCGWLFSAYNQEKPALGLKNMDNVVLYQNKAEFLKKYHTRSTSPELAKRIAAGQQHVEHNLGWNSIDKSIVGNLRRPEDYPLPLLLWRLFP